MSQALLFGAMHVVGAALCLTWGPRGRPWLCAALGFPVGLAVYVLLALGLLVAGLPYRLDVIAALGGLLMIAGGLRRRPRGADLRVLAGWTAGFAVVTAALASTNLSLLSSDSHAMVTLGQVIGADGRFADGVLDELNAWGVFLPVAQSASQLLSAPYLYALSPQLGLSFVALFAVVLGSGLRGLGLGRPPARWIALVTASLATIFFFQHHFLLIHNNLASAVYLFGYFALFWLAETERDTSLLPAAFLCALAAGLQRVEAPLFVLLLLAITCMPSQLPRRAVGVGFGFVVAILAGWFVVLGRHAPARGDFLTADRCYLLAAVMVVGLAGWAISGAHRARGVRARAPALVLAACAMALLVALVSKPEHMAVSVRAWAINLLVSGYWGMSWPLIAAMLIASTRLPRPPHGRMFAAGIAASVLLILVLAHGRSPYRAHHVGDSANRMMLHLLPMLFFYLALRAIPALAVSPPAPARDSAPPAAG